LLSADEKTHLIGTLSSKRWRSVVLIVHSFQSV
jgi:hypothetical protein